MLTVFSTRLEDMPPHQQLTRVQSSSARKFSDGSPEFAPLVPMSHQGHRNAIDRKAIDCGHLARPPPQSKLEFTPVESDPSAHDGNEATHLCQQAARLLARGEADDAYDIYCDVLAIDSHNVKALSALAVLNHKRGMFDSARTLYKRCLRVDPTRCKTAYNLGRLEHECRNFTEARELYRVTQQMDPDDETACSALAYEGLLLQEEFGDNEGAQRCYEVSLARDPEHVRTLDHKCALLVRCHESEEAKKLHDTVRALDPAHGTAWCPYTSSLFSGDLLDEKPSRSACNHHDGVTDGAPLHSYASSPVSPRSLGNNNSSGRSIKKLFKQKILGHP